MAEEQVPAPDCLAVALASEARALPFDADAARLDQHLLVDIPTVERLVESADIGPTDVVVDVGSGLGIIGAVLARHARRVVAVEIDTRFEPMLRRLERGTTNVDVKLGDFLDESLAGVDKIVANPPFGLLEPMLKKLVEASNVCLVALILGRNSAEALGASAGTAEFSRVSLLTQAYFDVSIEAFVPRTAFQPVPRTDGAITVLRRLTSPTREQRVLRALARAAVFNSGLRVRDVAATVATRPALVSQRIRPEQLANPDIWSRRLQRLSNRQLSAFAADLVRLAGTN